MILEYLCYLAMGLGIGYLVTLGVTGGPTDLDYRKQDLEARKERLRMLPELKRKY